MDSAHEGVNHGWQRTECKLCYTHVCVRACMCVCVYVHVYSHARVCVCVPPCSSYRTCSALHKCALPRSHRTTHSAVNMRALPSVRLTLRVASCQSFGVQVGSVEL